MYCDLGRALVSNLKTDLTLMSRSGVQLIVDTLQVDFNNLRLEGDQSRHSLSLLTSPCIQYIYNLYVKYIARPGHSNPSISGPF